MQIMGGESYMTENEVERVFRDSRINLIVEGANDLMWSFIFGYGGKQLAEMMLGIKNALLKDPDESLGAYIGKALRNSLRPEIMSRAIPLGLEVYFGVRRPLPVIEHIHPELRPVADRLSRMVREHTYLFKIMSKKYDVAMLERQAVQARLGNSAILLHAWACTLAKLDADLRLNGTDNGKHAGDAEFARDKAAALHFFDLAEVEIREYFRNLVQHADDTMLLAADAEMRHCATLGPEEFVIPEKTPTDLRGKGKQPNQAGIKQFPGDKASQFAQAPAEVARP
jgi:hypothetical protein